jgi:hypothetical protein
MPRQKEKLEIDALKTSLNLKNLELESISGEYDTRQVCVCTASSLREIFSKGLLGIRQMSSLSKHPPWNLLKDTVHVPPFFHSQLFFI